MRKLYLLSLLLPLWTLLPLWGQGGCLFAAVQVQNISTDYANKRVTFALSWAAGTRNATHNSKVWVFVDYQPVTGLTTGAWQRATVNLSALPAGCTADGSNTRGFWYQGQATAAQNANITVTLTNMPAQFNWCAYATDYPPNAKISGNSYTLHGTAPFTVNGTQLAAGVRTYSSACITSITDPTGCPGLIPAAPTVTTTNPAAICAGSGVTLTATPGGGTTTANTYTWNIGGATTTTTTNTFAVPAASITASKTFTVTVTNANKCISNTASGSITVVAAPAVPTLTNNGNKCVGTAITFTAGAVSGATGYEWTGSGITAGTVATTTRASNTTAGAKSAQVRAFITNSGITCYSAYSATSTATIYAVPAPTLSGGTTSIMVGASTTWNASIAGGTWSSSNTAVATVSNGTITGKAVGTATITYSVTQNGCAGSTTRTITVISAGGSGSGNGTAITNCSNPPSGFSFTSGFTSTSTWVVGSQTWSAPVTATYCNKSTYNGGSSAPYLTDCRTNSTAGYGHLFSWCMVAKFATTICPSGWRVPTSTDFYNLDKALGGTGANTQINSTLRNNYLNDWGCQYGGFSNYNAALVNQGTRAYYWSQTEDSADSGIHLFVATTAAVHPQYWDVKYYGFSLRCVK